MKNKMKKFSMFYNWIRWNCLNSEDWNNGEIPKGTMIDDDQFYLQLIKIVFIDSYHRR